ncbi:D-2-hydroxyacid dehydrogenase [Pseudoalteromonas sp. T1lg65]|uniref:D-2-hydroxyacid dehydrogenase n=1 Tax=Pseudoalteromonas sp. T1lg65 TaxID=2077101 RepID=UPI003F78FD95
MQIVVLDAKTLAGNDLSPLSRLGELAIYETTNEQQILERCKDAQVIITNKVKLNAATLESLPKLKLICVAATGVNNIDLQAAAAQHIAVYNVAGYSTPSVVQHTFTMLGNLLSNLHRYQFDCKQGMWQQSDIFCRLDYPITEIANKNFAIIGYGELGEAVAAVAKAFGAKVIIAERKDADAVRSGRTEFYQALRQADIISIHCPLTDQTRNLFDQQTLAMLKSTAVIINTARGGIVDEHALVNALRNNQLAGAAFDVLSSEPAQSDNPLVTYQAENLLLTPHIAWASKESIQRLIGEIANNISAFHQGIDKNRIV